MQNCLDDQVSHNPCKKSRSILKEAIQVVDHLQSLPVCPKKSKRKKKLKTKKSKKKSEKDETTQSVFHQENGLKQINDFDFNETTKLICDANRNKPVDTGVRSQKTIEKQNKESNCCNIMTLVKTTKNETLEKSPLTSNAKISTATTKPHVPVVRKFFDALENKIKTTLDKVTSNINKVKKCKIFFLIYKTRNIDRVFNFRI